MLICLPNCALRPGHGACPRRVSLSVCVILLLSFGPTAPPADVCGNRLSIYVLESSNSRRLTYFMPPLVSKQPPRYLIFGPCMTGLGGVADSSHASTIEPHSPPLYPPHEALLTCRAHPPGAHRSAPGHPPPVCRTDLGL